VFQARVKIADGGWAEAELMRLVDFSCFRRPSVDSVTAWYDDAVGDSPHRVDSCPVAFK